MRRTVPLPPAANLVMAVTVLWVAGACGHSSRTYELRGQILAVDTARQELTIKHGDIPGFMPGMTMAFKVGDERLLAGRAPGELVTATLVVAGTTPHLSAVDRTGFAPLPADARPRRAMSILSTGEHIRDVALVDSTGTARRFEEWRGQVLAVTFVYTRCPLPNFCPLIDRHFAQTARDIAAAADLRGRVRLVSVTLDPDHDTAAVLQRHAAALGADASVWTFLTGTAAAVADFGEQFGVSVIREGSDPADLVHNLRTAIVDDTGRLVKVLDGTAWTPQELLADIRDASARE